MLEFRYFWDFGLAAFDDGSKLCLVRKVNGKYVTTGTYEPEREEFLGMDDETRANALVAVSMFKVIPPQISIQTV